VVETQLLPKACDMAGCFDVVQGVL
jgi:hypothetical protein